MSKKISILGYWGYIPATIAKKGIDLIDNQMDKNDNKIEKIDDETEYNKDKINELAQSTDKESRKQWKAEYGKNIKTINKLLKSNDVLDSMRVAGEKIIYKPVNQLVAKRIRIEKEIINLQSVQKGIESNQDKIRQEILNTNRIEVKNKLNKELVGLQKNLDKITKKISKLSIKLNKIFQTADKMQDIIGNEFNIEEEYNMQISDYEQDEYVDSQKVNNKADDMNYQRIREVENNKKNKANQDIDQDIEENEKNNLRDVAKNISSKFRKAIKFFGSKIKNGWNKAASKVNLILSNINNKMLESAKKSEQKLEQNVQTFEDKRKKLVSDLTSEVEVKVPDSSRNNKEKTDKIVDKGQELSE